MKLFGINKPGDGGIIDRAWFPRMGNQEEDRAGFLFYQLLRVLGQMDEEGSLPLIIDAAQIERKVFRDRESTNEVLIKVLLDRKILIFEGFRLRLDTQKLANSISNTLTLHEIEGEK